MPAGRAIEGCPAEEALRINPEKSLSSRNHRRIFGVFMLWKYLTVSKKYGNAPAGGITKYEI
jgi:hypothetical protein